MTLSKRGLGLVTLALGIWYFWSARQFQPLPGEAFGPGLFPSLIAGAVIVCGLILTVLGSEGSGMLSRRFEAASLMRLAVMFGVSVLYMYAAEFLGFLLTGAIVIAGLALAFGVRWTVALPFGVVSAIVFSLIFETMLRVPLPRGDLGISF